MLSIIGSGCVYLRAGGPDDLRPTLPQQMRVVDHCATRCTDSADVVATGVAGFLVVPWRDSTRLVLTAPSFTNPTIWWMALGDLFFGTSPDTALISRRLAAMPAAGAERLSRVHALLVGHGHYDHLMDVPPLASRLSAARVFGSGTVSNLLAPVAAFATRRVVVDSAAARDERALGTPYEIGDALRITAVPWDHAPNVGSITIAPGEQRTPRTSRPRTVHGWKMGRVYAYTIDILDDTGATGLRLFFHDAAAGPDVQRNAGQIIAAMPPARTTVAILTAANFDLAPLYPDILLAHLAPQHVILGHWDDFFRSSEKHERVVRGIRAPALVDRLTPFVGDHWNAPSAGAVTRIRW